MKLITKSILLIVLIIIGIKVVTYSSETKDPPRLLPWTLPDYTQAKVTYEILDDGRLKIEIEHLFLRNIEPKMIAWFYQNLPIANVNLNGTTYPLYHLFHPTEHGNITVKEPATNGQPGMGEGALISRFEWFGPYTSKGAGRVIEFTTTGMKVSPEVAGLNFGVIHHEYVFRDVAGDKGTQYYVHSIIGSDWPLVGPIINYFIRHYMFPPEKLAQWLRHQVEEVSSLQFFLPVLYQTEAKQNHYKIDI